MAVVFKFRLTVYFFINLFLSQILYFALVIELVLIDWRFKIDKKSKFVHTFLKLL